MLNDNYGRTIDYLRLAVTDRCNLRCRYCMPAEGIDFAPREELLTFEEIERLSRILTTQLGVKKLRITGGEPFARRDLMSLLRQIRPFYRSVHMTTNATLLEPHLEALYELDIRQLNISIDSLQPERFFEITRRDMFDRVWSAIERALALDFRVKLNVVLMRDVNFSELPDFLELAKTRPLDVRFIEAMPFNEDDGNRNNFMSYHDMLAEIRQHYPAIRPEATAPNSASLHYQVPGFRGRIGLIPAYSRSLCGTCNRLRLTPKGQMRNCLYATHGLELRSLLRGGISDDDLAGIIRDFVRGKPKDGFAAAAERGGTAAYESMTTIGG
jgi:cyclic pyranopterin phosphate synthase